MTQKKRNEKKTPIINLCCNKFFFFSHYGMYTYHSSMSIYRGTMWLPHDFPKKKNNNKYTQRVEEVRERERKWVRTYATKTNTNTNVYPCVRVMSPWKFHFCRQWTWHTSSCIDNFHGEKKLQLGGLKWKFSTAPIVRLRRTIEIREKFSPVVVSIRKKEGGKNIKKSF